MTYYVDTSALLRLILREADAVDELRSADGLVSSELIAIEGARTLDRLRHRGSLSESEAAARIRVLSEWLEAIDLVLLRAPVLTRAADPLPTALGTLDALHLATALTWRDRTAGTLVVATHDEALAMAARSFGFDVVGV